MNTRIVVGVVIAAVFCVPVAVKLTYKRALEPVETEAVAVRQIRPTILASGVLAFHEEIRLSSELIGTVASIDVKEGMRVRKGDPLLRLDQKSYYSELEQQQSAIRSARIAIERARLQLQAQRLNLDRDAKLVEQGFISPSRFDEVSNQVALADVELQANREMLRQVTAQYALSQEKMAKTTVRAPIDGVVTSLNIKVGETAVPNATGVPGSSLLTISDDASMLVDVNVDEADIASVATGQHAAVYPSAASEASLDGEIQSISPAPRIGAQGRSYIVKVKLAGRQPRLRTGMTARVEIAGGNGFSRPAVSLRAVLSEPQGSNSKDNASSYVLKVVDGVVRKAKVNVGLADNSHQEVLAGVADGEVVVIGPARALRELREGQGVQAVPAAGNVAADIAGGPRS